MYYMYIWCSNSLSKAMRAQLCSTVTQWSDVQSGRTLQDTLVLGFDFLFLKTLNTLPSAGKAVLIQSVC